MYIIRDKEFKCAIDVVQSIFNDKWKLSIIWKLLQGEKRYKDLHKEACEITQKTLTVKLRELEECKLIKREAFPEIPPRVVYSLSDDGEALRGILESMYEWSEGYVNKYGKITDDGGNCC